MLNVVWFCETPRDFTIASNLFDRVLTDWGPPGVAEAMQSEPDAVRSWVKDDTEQPYFALRRLDQYASAFGLRLPHAGFRAHPSASSRLSAETVFSLSRRLADAGRIDVVVVVWNLSSGGHDELAALQRMHRITQGSPDCRIVWAHPNPNIDAWALTGYQPQNDTERAELAALEQQLGFDPRLSPDQLLTVSSVAVRDVLRKLSHDNTAREQSCWQRAPLDVLWRRGDPSGLRAYLSQLQDDVLPLCPLHALPATPP
jgi:hypothetical protein